MTHVRPSALVSLFSGIPAISAVSVFAVAGCVPPGSAGPQQDAGQASSPVAPRPSATALMPSVDVMTAPFEDDFERKGAASAPSSASPRIALGANEAGAATDGAVATGGEGDPGRDPGPEWMATAPGVWHIEDGRLCGEHARNHGIWLKRVLPVNARIEFDALSQSADGDLKAEYWGDGRSFATSLSYTNATSYLSIFGGWHNTFHVLARINEHATDRKEIGIDRSSDDPREKPVVAGQRYHFKVERLDGRTVRWWVDGNEMLTYPDPAPLVGSGHDHFGFNDWDAKVCFDNVRVAPLP